MIFKTAAVRHPIFRKLAVFIMLPLSACPYASIRIQNFDEIGQSVDCQKAKFKMAAAAILNSKNFNFW